MAPLPDLAHNTTNNFSPLADYFFIAGIESSQILEERPKSTLLSGETIEEHSVLETESTPRPRTPDGTELAGSPKTKSRFSYDARKSFTSLLSQESKVASNRSSATIRQVPPSGGLSDEDFDVALKKFANEREMFLEEIQVNGGSAPSPAKLRPRPKTQRIISDEAPNSARSGVGSLRRRLSTMNNSLKRSPSVMRPAPSVRTSKRLSGYNSVIPTPQPFHLDANTHPLKRHYEPVLLDRYPPRASPEEAARSSPFPDYVPMFAFPNDVNVVPADERPKSTWHGFAMTTGDGSKLYGICLTVWLPLNPKAAEGLERLCEKWRQANMSPEERELAGSLGERLALERAKLSRLLAELPTMLQGSSEREELEEQISAVEEKIGLMTDLLRPVRHGAASKIDGLTDGDTGLWIPRAYGVMGKDVTLTSFWKEWLRAVAVPMSNNTILRVPPSSPKVGMWQPLERYVINLCAEAPCPISSLTQVEINVRELRLFARKEAVNEIPGSRNIDIFALFRALSIPNIVILLEYILAESRIILLSSHASMLHLASNAITSLLYPLKWQGVFIPVLPARLIQAIEAPCPYIVGIERSYENVQYPDDDFVLVDLDQNTIESTGLPTPLPRQIRRKLQSLLQVAAPHHLRYGVPTGPPQYAKEAYAENAFSSEHPSLYMSRAPNSTLATLVSFNSAQFDALCHSNQRAPIFNAFLQSRGNNSRGSEARPGTSSTSSKSRSNTGPPSPRLSPISGQFPSPPTPVSRNDSAHAVHHTLREKRSHIFEHGRRSSSVSLKQSFNMHVSSASESTPRGFGRHLGRRPSQNILGHMPTNSSSTLGSEFRVGSSYAPSIYAPSTMAASTIMPNVLMQPVRNTDTTQWVEGHCLQWHNTASRRNNPTISDTCTLCDERSDGDGLYACAGCNTSCHPRCISSVTIVCPTAFRGEQVRAAFVRCFASLFYTYRRYMTPASYEQRKNGMKYKFQSEAFLRSLPNDLSEYLTLLQDTQSFNEFISERETSPADNDPQIQFFDQIITSKRNRGKSSWLSRQSSTSFLDDTSTHLWRNAVATPPSARFPGDYRSVVTRIPAKLDVSLMKEPRAMAGVPVVKSAGKVRRKGVPSISGSIMLNGGTIGGAAQGQAAASVSS